jgi:hypothetical protein
MLANIWWSDSCLPVCYPKIIRLTYTILPAVLHCCETWSLTLREKRRLSVFEDRVLRWIFGAKKNKLTGEWRKLNNEELHGLYCSPHIVLVIKSRRKKWAGHVARMGRDEVHTGIWWGSLNERDQLEDPCVEWRILLNGSSGNGMLYLPTRLIPVLYLTINAFPPGQVDNIAERKQWMW